MQPTLDDIVIDLTREEFKAWIGSPTTKKVFQAIELYAQDYANALTAGSTVNLDSIEATALRTTNVTSFLEGVRTVCNLEELLFEEQEEETKEDEEENE